MVYNPKIIKPLFWNLPACFCSLPNTTHAGPTQTADPQLMGLINMISADGKSWTSELESIWARAYIITPKCTVHSGSSAAVNQWGHFFVPFNLGLTHTCTVSTHTRSCCQHLGLPYRFGRLCTEQTEDRRTVLWTDRLWEKWWEAVEVKGRSRLKLKGVLVRECLAECVQYVCARIFLLKSKKPAAEVFLNTGWFGNRIQVQLQLVQFKISPGATISS